MEIPIVVSCYYWGSFVAQSDPRGTRLSTPLPFGETGTLTGGGKNQALCLLGPLESQTAKALVLRRRCDPPGCEEIVGGAAQGQDDSTALGGVLEL